MNDIDNLVINDTNRTHQFRVYEVDPAIPFDDVVNMEYAHMTLVGQYDNEMDQEAERARVEERGMRAITVTPGFGGIVHFLPAEGVN